MPRVPERPLSSGELFNNDARRIRVTHEGTNDFPTYEFIERVKGSKNGPVKVIRPPKNKRQKLPEPYRSEYRNAMSHLRSIQNEHT